MKNQNTIKTLFSAGVLVLTSMTMLSCGNTEEKQDNSETKKEAAPVKIKTSSALVFAELLNRDEKLSQDEFEKIKSKFTANKNKFNKDNTDYTSLLKVVEVYIYEARVTGEHPHYYSAALTTLNWMLEQESSINKDQKFNALFYKSTVLLSQHKFNEALEIGELALAMNDKNSGIYGVLVDANVEIGNYEEAVKMSDKMMAMRPDLRSYSRVSYLREIYGDNAGAKQAMITAVKTGDPISEYTCWGLKTLGEIYESEGKLDSAATCYEITLERRANYPFGIAGLARIASKKGNTTEALKLYGEALAILPEIGFNIDVANLKKKEGTLVDEAATIAEIETMFQEDIESGHNMSLEYAGFLAEFKGDYAQALTLAKEELVNRPKNIDVNKQIAFIYYKQGNMEEAQKHLTIAQATNKTDAEMKCLEGLITKDATLVKASFDLNPYQNHLALSDAKKIIKA
ncbi:MAG: tetratricopeptide (TPR) repeat protein [Flavobacteriales bacterium]|jgi:tetratricopeptide (TPR) repeat protein